MADNEIQSSSVQLAPIEMDNSTNPKEKKIKRKMEKKGSPLVENEVRRSPRLKEIYKGFKQNVYFNKKCLVCAPNPPTLPVKIKKLAVDFCKVDEALVSEDELNKKHTKTEKVIYKKEARAMTEDVGILGCSAPDKINVDDETEV